MYLVDKHSNTVQKLDQKLFKELKLRERDHLQEWIAKYPEMLGEELLIIQKEFDGFNETSDRLDLLAIDKDGNLVIIENKLDDTGRNVVWQALKYTSYCSTLTTSQIVKIYQDYLNRWNIDEDAKENLVEFLGSGDEDLLLNRNDQRIIFVANHFRKEVTSTVLWLLNHGIRIQCFRATPYSLGDNIFLQVEQIIPLPETTEFMINAMEKEKEVKEKSKVIEKTEADLIKLWSMLHDALKSNHTNYLERVSVKPYFDTGFWKGAGRFGFCVGRTTYRVELYISSDMSKHYIDAMAAFHDEIASVLDGDLKFERLDGKKASRIRLDMSESYRAQHNISFANTECWPKIISWYVDSMNQFYSTVAPFWDRVTNELQHGKR